jgi:hypothetical protein
MTMNVQPGDVLAVRGGGWASWWIRFGEALRDQPNMCAHIAVVHHVTDGVTWCIEGAAGGVGWRDAQDYLESPWTVTNIDQPKTEEQRKLVCDALVAAIGTPYDWNAVAQDAAEALHLPVLFSERISKKVPGHVVCSSLAEWAYMRGDLDRPQVADIANTFPSDWVQFCILRQWAKK